MKSSDVKAVLQNEGTQWTYEKNVKSSAFFILRRNTRNFKTNRVEKMLREQKENEFKTLCNKNKMHRWKGETI